MGCPGPWLHNRIVFRGKCCHVQLNGKRLGSNDFSLALASSVQHAQSCLQLILNQFRVWGMCLDLKIIKPSH
jgi:hypothetical protein